MHQYLYLLRPPNYACQPDGFIERKGGLPKKDWITPRGIVNAFGIVTYPEALPFEVLDHWSLSPCDPVEWAHYTFWLFADRRAADAKYYEQDFLNAPKELVPSYLADAIRFLREAQK